MFTPFASLSSVRVVLSITATHGFKIYQMDIVTGFLGSKIEEEVYVSLPEGILGSTRVASLNRSLYGLKQSPRCWYTTIDAFLIGKMGIRRGRFDCCIYTDEHGSVLALYVDDILITGTSKNIHQIRQQLKAKFEMVDLGPVSHFLGMVIIRKAEKRQIYFSQQGYIDQVLEIFAITECKPVARPIDKDKPGLRMREDLSCNWELYLKLIRSLSWIAIGTRPDISFVVSYLGRFNADPSLIHWTCVKRVLGYLKGTKHLKPSLEGELQKSGELKEGFKLSGYVDSDFAREVSSLKSITGYVLLLRSGIVQ